MEVYAIPYTVKVSRQKNSRQVVHTDLREKTFAETLMLELSYKKVS